uniref:Uncharacterized protein n=1 Tax=Cucumis melo TaxID=3656 RepID=A0A9I9EG33_CUCME
CTPPISFVLHLDSPLCAVLHLSPSYSTSVLRGTRSGSSELPTCATVSLSSIKPSRSAVEWKNPTDLNVNSPWPLLGPSGRLSSGVC